MVAMVAKATRAKAVVDARPLSNKRLERTRHNGSSICSNLGEPLKRSVRCSPVGAKMSSCETPIHATHLVEATVAISGSLIRHRPPTALESGMLNSSLLSAWLGEKDGVLCSTSIKLGSILRWKVLC